MLTMTFKARVSSLGDIVVFLINYAWTIMSNAIGIWYTVYRFQQSIMCFTVSICRFFINFTSLITLVSIFAVTETQTYTTDRYPIFIILPRGAAVVQWLRRCTFAQWTWVQFPLVLPIWVIGGSRKGIRRKLLPCIRKFPLYVGMSERS